MSSEESQGWLRFGLRWSLRVFIALLLVAGVAFCVVFRAQLYHHFYLFPKQKAAWAELAAQRAPVSLKSGWNEYRGILHCHSKLSHDSIMEFPDILDAMHQAHCQFIFMTDHIVDGKADYSLGWNGIHDGVLFVHGYEMNYGFMPWGLPETTILNANDPPAQLAKQIRGLGGLLFYAHCEENRHWELPEVQGTEIYNIHSDLLLNQFKYRKGMIELGKEVLINQRSYPEQTLRGAFHRTTLELLLKLWDEQTVNRKLTAIAANDCHNNAGFRLIYTDHDTVFLIDTGHNTPKYRIFELKLNLFTRPLLRLFFGPLEPNKQLFRFDLDPYARMSRFVNTYLLAKDLTEPDLFDALRTGRAYVAFTMLADPLGFAYVAEGNGKKVTMGESIPLSPDLKIEAATPLPCRFTLVRNGVKVTQQEGAAFNFPVKEPGKYRVEAELNIVGEWTPWIYANPIEVTP